MGYSERVIQHQIAMRRVTRRRKNMVMAVSMLVLSGAIVAGIVSGSWGACVQCIIDACK